ncbi:MAG: recombinase family protein [Archangium sp.]|nr:recombinase family protein [Archangium sp.]
MKKPPVSADSPRKCAVYTRKSTTAGLEQEFNSLDAQREACVAYVNRQQNWKLLDEHYDDGGFTGANTDRPAFQRLMADVESGKVDIVVVYKVDRLSRSLLDFAKVMERLDKAGASFVSVTQNFSTADAMGRLTMNLLASFAEFEREMISERTRDKIAASRRRGKWTGGPCPFGYNVVDKKLTINELEAPIVREAFEVLLQHRRMATVAAVMNERERLPRKTKRLDEKPQWTKDTIAKLLRNPLYGGLMMYRDERHPGEHPAIIDPVTFQRAQVVLAGRERHLKFHGLNFDYILRGLIKCGKCGKPMTPASTRKGRSVYRYYRCTTRDKRGTDACDVLPLAAGAIEDYVVDRIAEASLGPTLMADIEQALAARLAAKRQTLATVKEKAPDIIAEHSSKASKLVDELTRLEGRSRGVAAAKLRAETDLLTSAERSLADAERGLVEVLGAIADLKPVLRVLGNFKELWGVMTPTNRVRMLSALIDEVRVHEQDGSVNIALIDFANEEAA